MLTAVDYTVIGLYLLAVATFGILAGGRQTSTDDYFLGDRTLPWWAVCFSVVATETSTLTVIGVPAVAFAGSLTFVQLTFGYLIGRIVVAVYFLPMYYEGELQTAYAFLGNTFGNRMRVTASITFLLTRLLADGVRLFATAIPLRLIAQSAGFDPSYLTIVSVIALVTAVYTLVGGIKAVVWMDVIQMLLYVGGAGVAILVLLGDVPAEWWARAADEGKTQILDFNAANSIAAWLTHPYAFVTAVVGGAIFSMASHGTDQLIVQRLLACRNLWDSQKALVGSGVVVFVQFALFLFVGLLLWSYYGEVSFGELGLTRADEVFPRFIIEGLPPGISGLILAGIVAAAMSTLSSSLNALASSTMLDLYERIRGRAPDPHRSLQVSRVLTLLWALVFVLFASFFQDQQHPVVELGLEIASFTYGALLGVFLLGLLNKRSTQNDAVITFLSTIAMMVFVVFCVWFDPGHGWAIIPFPSDAVRVDRALQSIGWPWYTVIGTTAHLTLGSLLALRHRASSTL